MWLLDHMVGVYFVLWEKCQTVFRSDRIIWHPHQQWLRILIGLQPHQYLVLADNLNFGHSNGCVVVSCFNLHFLVEIWCRASFRMFSCQLNVFGEVSVPIVLRIFFFNWLACFAYCWKLILGVFCIFCLAVLHQIRVLQRFLSIVWSVSSLP